VDWKLLPLLNEFACYCYTPVVISKSFQPHYGSIAIKGKVIRECVPPRNCESHLHFRANGDGSCTANEGAAGANITCLDMQFSSWDLQLNERGIRVPEVLASWVTGKRKMGCTVAARS
jgi:hypothetical protein